MNKPVAVCLAVAPLVLGCAGYRTKFAVPAHLKTFSVATFANKTLERNLDFEFTQALVHEILAKTDLKVAPPHKAHLVITGEIDSRDRHIIRRKHRGLKSEVRHVFRVNVKMLDRVEDTLFFEGTRLTRRTEFRLNRGEDRRHGREEGIRELARRVVALAFERWPRTQPRTPIVEAEPRGR